MLPCEAIVNDWLPAVVEFKFNFFGCFSTPLTRLALLAAPNVLLFDVVKFVFTAVACLVDIDSEVSMLAPVPVPGVYCPVCS